MDLYSYVIKACRTLYQRIKLICASATIKNNKLMTLMNGAICIMRARLIYRLVLH